MSRLTGAMLVALAVALTAAVYARSSANPQADAKNPARKVLSGGHVIVRLYPDWQTDPKAYVTLDVPLEGSEVKTRAIRSVYTQNRSETKEVTSQEPRGTELDEAIIVVMPADQQDQAVIDALGGLIFVQSLRQGSLTLRPRDSARTPLKPCLFLDALDQPLPNAEVEILISPDNYSASAPAPRVWIADAQLDEQSCLQPPESVYGLNQLTFHVVHPDCGTVPAVLQYASTGGPHHVFRIGAMPKYRWCVFLDALGHPMAGAQVQMITSGSWEDGRMTFLDPIILDAAGRLQPPPVLTSPRRCSFIVSDPNDGMMALVEPYLMTEVSEREPLGLCVVPLVTGGTQANAGSIRGIVIDSEGNLVPAAIVACMRISVPGAGVLGPYWPWSAQGNKEVKVLTNDRGQFAMCLPLVNHDGTLGLPVPAGARYEVTVTPPAEFGCQPYRGRLAAGQEHTIVLEGTLFGPEKYTGILMFEDERGPVTDPEKVSQVNLTIRVRRPGSPVRTFSYRKGEWLEKSALPFGTYEAKVDWDGKHYEFRPVRVTAESPGTLVFRPGKIEPFETRYRGRVIHGVNGDPIAGAIVMPLPSAKEFDPTSPEFDPQSKPFRRLQEQMAGRMTRTDSFGRFELALPIVVKPGPEHAIIAIKKDFFAFLQPRSYVVSGDRGEEPRRREFAADRSARVILPDMKLFPAGTAITEPNTPDDCRDRRVMLEFLPAPDSPAPWLKDLQALPSETSLGNVIRRPELIPQKRQSVRVPAYVRMVLRVRLADDRYAPTVIEDVLVAQGKTLDLGRIDFARAVPIAVKVVNSADEPLAGITVKCLLGKTSYPGPEAVTDANGITRISVGARSAGHFVVECRNREPRRAVREGTPFQIKGAEDIGREFILRLSDDFLRQLLESTGGTPGNSLMTH